MATKSTRERDQAATPAAVVEKPDALARVRKPGTFAPGNQVNSHRNHRNNRFITQHLINMLNEEISNPSMTIDEAKKNPKKAQERAKRVHFLCDKMISMAIAGDTTCMKMIMDRVEGTPLQTVHFKDDSMASVDLPHEYTKEELAKLPASELSKLYSQSILADKPAQGSA
jgi:hypothetical protein